MTYRPAAGLAVFNARGQVFLGRRNVPTKNRAEPAHIWQMPQGGIDKGEDPLAGAYRELREETGLKRRHVQMLARLPVALHYDFPADVLARGGKYLGQRQTWYALRLIADDTAIDLGVETPPEFSDWRWGTLAEAVDLVVPFKRLVYAEVARHFAPFEVPTA